MRPKATGNRKQSSSEFGRKSDLEKIMAAIPPLELVTPMHIYDALTAAEARGYERGRAGLCGLTVQEQEDLLKEARKQGFLRCREEAAKVNCIYCADGWPLNEDGTEHTLKPGGRILMPAGRCSSVAIRSLKP